MRPIFDWKLCSRSLRLGPRTLIMAVVNVTPDSFSDGGQFFAPDRAIGHALESLEAGADIIDVGGESTRPGKRAPVSAEEEKRRVLPVIEGLLKQIPHAVISIDTYKAETAQAALAAGAQIINDVSGLTWDEDMVAVVARRECGCVLMHTRGRPEDWQTLPALAPDQVVPLVLGGLEKLAERAVAHGVARERMVLDPGFGFGKRLDENFPLLAHLSDLGKLGFPLLAGTSHKSFVAKASALHSANRDAQRLAGSIAALTASILNGAHIVRVHDVAASIGAARLADAIATSRDPTPDRSQRSAFGSEA